jgi:tetratricopeptide (TPR) repeat protein
MFGRLLRILVGIAILMAAVDVWKPSMVPHGIPVRLGDFEDFRNAAIGLLAIIGGAFVLAGLLAGGRRRRVSRTAPNSAFALAPVEDLDIKPTAATATVVTAPASLVRAPEPRSITTASFSDPAPRVEPAPLEETSTHAWVPAPMPVLAEAPLADAQPLAVKPEPAPPPAAAVVPGGPDRAAPNRAAFVAASEAGDKMRLEGRMDDAMEHYAHALDLARHNLRVLPHDVQAHADIAAGLTNVGDVHDTQGRLEPALAAYEESLTFHRALAAHSPQDRAAQRGLSLSLEKLADTREARGHRSRALDLYRESLPIAEKLAAAHPGDALLRQDLQTTKDRLATLEAQMA